VPQYHFNWDFGSQRVRDEVGVELTDDDTARQHADAHRELCGFGGTSLSEPLRELVHNC
jgi:hypothetical protein